MTGQPLGERLQGVKVATSFATSKDDARRARAPRKGWGLKVESFVAAAGGLEQFSVLCLPVGLCHPSCSGHAAGQIAPDGRSQAGR